MSWELDIPMEPKPLKRHRSRVQRTKDGGSFAQVYDDPANQANRDEILWRWRALGAPMFPAGKPIDLDITAAFQRPKSDFDAQGVLKPGVVHYCTKVPDMDNVLKLVGDALNGWAWEDDRLICTGSFMKVWSNVPGQPFVRVKAALL